MKTILCLPGFGTNATILKFQMKQIESSLKSSFKFMYINPTNVYNKNAIDDEMVLAML